MTLRLNLPPTVESGLQAQAQQQGLSLEVYVSKVLEERSAGMPKPIAGKKKSLVELFEPLRGLNLDLGRNPSTGRPVDL